MDQKKNNKIILIAIIVVLIVILIALGAYAFLGTDLLKSNKNLFFKYTSQLADEKQGSMNEYLKQYTEKKKTTPYKDNGTIRFQIEADDIAKDELDLTNNCTITYTGNVDSANSKANQDISINYSDDVKFPVTYLQNKNSLGLKTEYIGSKYIALELDKLSEMADIDLDQVTEVIDELDKGTLSEEEISHIKETYWGVIEQELNDSNFSKVEGSQKGYKLTLNGEQLKNIFVKLLETLKNDDITLEKINEYFSSSTGSVKITGEDIDDIIEEINEDTDINDETLEIIVYTNKGKASKLELKINEAKITIEKVETGNSIQYNLALEIYENNETMATIYFNMKYSGLQALQSITEDYELGLTFGDNKYVYYLNHNVDFADNVTIDEITDDNSLILTDQDPEQVDNFIQAVAQRIDEVDKKQMEELGLSNSTNPLLNIIPNFNTIYSTMNSNSGYNNLYDDDDDDFDMFGEDEQSTSLNNLSEIEVETFNKKFENYEGTNVGGATLKGLFTTIQLNNETYEDDEDYQIKEINFNGDEYEATEEKITLIKSEIEVESNYKVEFEKDSDTGMIYRVIINKK